MAVDDTQCKNYKNCQLQNAIQWIHLDDEIHRQNKTKSFHQIDSKCHPFVCN